jgi:hypothetical protein
MTREIDLDALFGRDDDADFLADQAEALFAELEEMAAAERALDALDAILAADPEPEPPAPASRPAIRPLWAGLLAVADGRRGADSRQSKRERRARAFARCA